MVDAAGRAIKADGESIAEIGHDIDSDWQGLKQFYFSPEAKLLFEKTKEVASAGDKMKAPLQVVGQALIDFAETAKLLVADLNRLKSKAVAFRKKIDGDDDWREDEDKVNEHNNLNDDIFAKLVAYQTAERDCANKITALFGGTHFIGTDPTSGKQFARRGDEVYGFTKPVDGIETPWAKPQTYDAPWYEDVGNGIKDFGVGIAQGVSSFVGMYGADGWGWQGTDGLLDNWESLDKSIAGLSTLGPLGLLPDGWGASSWGDLNDNWLNLVKGLVPYQEWDGGNGAGYVITNSILNVGSLFVGPGIVKGAAAAVRGLKVVEGVSEAGRFGSLGRDFMAGFKDAYPSIANLKDSLDKLTDKLGKQTDLLDDADNLHVPDAKTPDIPDQQVPDHEPVHVGDNGHPGGHHDTNDHDGGHNDRSGNEKGGNDGRADPNSHHEPNDGNAGTGDDRTDSNRHHDPGGQDDSAGDHGDHRDHGDHGGPGHDGHADPNGRHDSGDGPADPNKGHDNGTPDPAEAKKLARANRLENNLRDGGLTDDQISRLRGDLSRDSHQWQRLASALEQGFGKKVKGLLHPRAVDFAMDGGRTIDPKTFAYRYEYFKARFDQLQEQVRKEVGSGQLKLDHKSVTEEAAERFGDLDLKADLKADLDALQGVRPHPASVKPSLSGPDLEAAVRSKAGDIDMGSDTAAAYHARKHYHELPADEVTGNLMRDYFGSAQRTIHDGQLWRREPLNGGGERLFFLREVVDATGKTRKMQAVVIARDGRLIMSTYRLATQ